MREHGDYTVEVENEIIIVTFIGMFNELASKNVCNIVEEYIDSLNGNYFYMLMNLLMYEGSTPEGHEVGNKHAIWLERQNCLGKAVVTTGEVLLDIVRNEQDDLKHSNIVTNVFQNKLEAKNWLLSLQKI